MNAPDTNVLIYAHDPRDPAKQERAVSLIQSLTEGVLLWQVACEYLAASRKLETLGYNREQAWQDIQDFRQVWTTVLPGWEILDEARRLTGNYSFSFWDAMIVAACLRGDVTCLYTEDFDGYQDVDGLEIVNPFKGL